MCTRGAGQPRGWELAGVLGLTAQAGWGPALVGKVLMPTPAGLRVRADWWQNHCDFEGLE